LINSNVKLLYLVFNLFDPNTEFERKKKNIILYLYDVNQQRRREID